MNARCDSISCSPCSALDTDRIRSSNSEGASSANVTANAATTDTATAA